MVRFLSASTKILGINVLVVWQCIDTLYIDQHGTHYRAPFRHRFCRCRQCRYFMHWIMTKMIESTFTWFLTNILYRDQHWEPRCSRNTPTNICSPFFWEWTSNNLNVHEMCPLSLQKGHNNNLSQFFQITTDCKWHKLLSGILGPHRQCPVLYRWSRIRRWSTG